MNKTLLAALLPALFAGVGSVAVLRVGGGGAWPPQVLAAILPRALKGNFTQS